MHNVTGTGPRWRVGTNYPCRIISELHAPLVYVGDPQDEGSETEAEKAYAREIVKTLNLHPRLVEALRRMLHQWESWDLQGSPTDEEIMDEARALMVEIDGGAA